MPIYYPPLGPGESYGPDFYGQIGPQLADSITRGLELRRQQKEKEQQKRREDAASRLQLILKGAELSKDQQEALINGVQADPELRSILGPVLGGLPQETLPPTVTPDVTREMGIAVAPGRTRKTITREEPPSVLREQAATASSLAQTELTKEQLAAAKVKPKTAAAEATAMLDAVSAIEQKTGIKYSDDEKKRIAIEGKLPEAASGRDLIQTINTLQGMAVEAGTRGTDISDSQQALGASVGLDMRAIAAAAGKTKAKEFAAIHEKGQPTPIEVDLGQLGIANTPAFDRLLTSHFNAYLLNQPGVDKTLIERFDENDNRVLETVPTNYNPAQQASAIKYAITKMPAGTEQFLAKWHPQLLQQMAAAPVLRPGAQGILDKIRAAKTEGGKAAAAAEK